MKWFKFILFFIFLIALFPSGAYAYIDPGTGSYILQILIAGALGMAYTVKIYWRRIKEFVGNKLHNHNIDE